MRNSLTLRSPLAALLSVGLGCFLAACGGSKVAPTTEELAPPVPGPNTPYFVLPTPNPVDSTLPKSVNDPGPGPTADSECHAPDGMVILPMSDFSGSLIAKSYTFNDTTSKLWPVALADWEPAATPIPPEWGNLCAAPGQIFAGSPQGLDSHAMHLAGVFHNYGAGIGTAFFNHQTTLQDNPPINFTLATDMNQTVINGYAGDKFLQYADASVFAYADLSAYDGVVFWARRGPYGEPGFRVAIADRTTSDDYNRQLPPDLAACRSKYILCSCQNGSPCTHFVRDPALPNTDLSVPKTGDYCWDPALDATPSVDPTQRCGQTACDSIDIVADRDINQRVGAQIPSPLYSYISNPVNAARAAAWFPAPGKITCSPEPYVFKDSTMPSGRYCYDPSQDLPPPEAQEQCGDSFLAPVSVDLDWHRYTVAFNDMRQGNIDKRSPGMDKTRMLSVIFAFPGGNLDVWIDGLGLYRKK